MITEETIWLDFDALSREDAIHKICGTLFLQKKTLDPALLYKDIIKREKLVSTFAGSYTAIPHVITQHISEPTLCFIRTSNPDLTWNGKCEAVSFIIFVAVPKNEHIKTLREKQSRVFGAIAQLISKIEVIELWKTTNDKQVIRDCLNHSFG